MEVVEVTISNPSSRRKAAVVGLFLAFVTIAMAVATLVTGAMRPGSTVAVYYHTGQVAAEWGGQSNEWQ